MHFNSRSVSVNLFGISLKKCGTKLFPGVDPLHKTLALKLAPECGIQCLFLSLKTLVKFLSEIDIKNTKILFGIRLNLAALEILANSLLNTV